MSKTMTRPGAPVGNILYAPHQAERLRALGAAVPTYTVREPQALPEEREKLGALSEAESAARAKLNRLRDELEALEQQRDRAADIDDQGKVRALSEKIRGLRWDVEDTERESLRLAARREAQVKAVRSLERSYAAAAAGLIEKDAHETLLEALELEERAQQLRQVVAIKAEQSQRYQNLAGRPYPCVQFVLYSLHLTADDVRRTLDNWPKEVPDVSGFEPPVPERR